MKGNFHLVTLVKVKQKNGVVNNQAYCVCTVMLKNGKTDLG